MFFLPAVTTLEDRVFYNSDALTTVDLPLATTIKSYVFSNCDDLSIVKIATGDGVQLSKIYNTTYTSMSGSFYSSFYGLYTEDITLTVGSANAEYVSGNTLKVGSVSVAFKDINIQ